nr:putative late blight resistance protein homolog R1B-8 [Ipomoea batatas]
MTIVFDKVVENLASKVVNKFLQTVAANIDLVSGIGSAIEDLTSDIEMFNARLVDVSKNQDASELQVLRVVVKKFRTVVAEAQDAVAKYIALNKKHEDNGVAKCFNKIPVPVCGNINVHAKEIQSISRKMNKLLQTNEKDLISYMTYKSGQEYDMQPPQPIVEQDVTGFEDEEKRLNDRLNASSNDRIVIPIVGLPGTGKTTFANQIFHNTEKQKTFGPTIWVHVSHSFDKKQKYIDMLCDITRRPKDEYSSIAEDRLGARIRDLLKDKKYFIVLDDIWEAKDWNSLNAVLPNNSQGSRVLVTTRYSNVVDFGEEPHILQPLKEKVSWEIIEKIVFGKKGCTNNDLKSLGEDIAKRCNGVPLSIVMVGGILRKRIAQAYWKRVSENPLQVINRGDQSFHKVVKLSYDHLPHENLRNCFLYFASFPKGQEIAALKLIRLWIAEGFIPTIDEWGYNLDLEVEAESYLKELVDRNLVIVMKRSADGEIKTCRIHDSLHEFCKTEASKDNLFYIIDGEQGLEPNTIQSRRRLCFHPSSSSTTKIFDVENNNNPCCRFLSCCNKMKKIPYPSGEHVHSLLLCSLKKSDIDLKQEELIAIPNAFPLLRVLDIESFKLSFQLPNELFSLNLLKYLAITTNVNLLPKAFKNLRELQTLVIKTTEGTVLEIKGGIWNMEKLTHVQTNASMQLPSPPPQKTWQNNTTGKTNIHTLSSVSPTSCTKMIFNQTPHLKKLGVRGNLAELLKENEEICLFNNLQMLKCLENLKLYGQDENALKVPMLDKFASRVRKLTFYKTFFKWDDMGILGSLEELEVLKLDENAFRGERWNLKSDVFFNQLQYLRIGRTNLETWTIMENNFPVLENLVLRNCTSLEAIPIAFAKVQSLKVIELYHMSEDAINSAKEVAEQRHKEENVKGLDLEITPFLPKATLSKMAPVVEEDIVVGFDDEVKIIKDRLFRESMNLKVISIVGMIGVGKTTFVKMVFNDMELKYEFFTQIWVYVSQACDRRKIFIDILSIFTTTIDGFPKMSDENLAERIKEYLEGGKYLIVLDEVWTKKDWEKLKIAFPNNVKGSRILVTTRYQNVASHIDSSGIPHELKGLSDGECWKLLKKKIFGGEGCPTTLEDVGRSIAKKCNGVPLAVGKISGVLSQNMILEDWRRIAPFPRGSEIDVRELMYLWVAEGFISGEDDLEYAAEKYLKDFVERNLLMVVSRRADDRIKRVRIHGLLHEIFIREAAKPRNNLVFLSEFQVEGGAASSSNNTAYGRRLYLHSSSSALALHCISKITNSSLSSSSDHVQSFLSFSSKQSIEEIPEEVVAAIPNAFPNLQVLNIRGFKFPSKQLPKELYRLQHLTYLGITIIDLKLLPQEFGSLTHLQTLVLHTTPQSNSTCVKIEADIWSCMPKLRHLLTNNTSRLRLQLPSPIIRSSRIINGRKKSSSGVVSNITTLSTISPTSCTPQILDKTPQIKKLGICGNLAELMDVNQGGVSPFDNLHKLDRLENLKLININDALQSNTLRSFPRAERFPRRLRKMTLSNTSFEWRDLSALGSLDELEVLKLEDNAFRGESCDVRTVVFKQLKYFRIESTDLVSWTASKDSFPVLKCLFLIHCTELDAVPVEFGEIESLKLLKLYYTNYSAVNSAQEIQKLKGGVKNGGFQLSVYPPKPKDTVVEEAIVAGYKGVRIIKDRLIDEGLKNLAFISIVGKRGIGKTKLAAMIFKELELEYKFFIRLWVDVSESYSRKKIFLNILSMLITDQVEEYDDMIEEELVKKIEKLLYGGKYLIVIDDLRMEHDWEGLKKAFPDNMNGSRILITTRNYQVASDADSDPVELAGKAASNEDGKLAETAQLNYHKLDSKMKGCFQYFAAFPEELVIDARKLMHMWIAEGLIVETSEPEHTAEIYLNALVENHLLIASKRRADGEIKTVCIHYLLLDFCRNEAANQDLFRTLEGRLGGVSNDCPRLYVHSSLLQQDTSGIINALTPRENVQAFLSFSSDATQIPEAVMAAITNAFPNLKVLDIGSIQFPHLPKEIYRLHHLRYLAISTHLNHLPKEFRNLKQLQVLVFHTTQSALKIDADIWNMPNLRHLHTNTPAKFPNPTPRNRTGSACITTLSTISPTSCRKEILDKARNLRKLRIRGNLGGLMETRKGGISLFDNLQQLSVLENLKLLNSAIPGQAATRLQSIPQHDKFPQRLRKLTLSNTSLEWKNMCVLGKLEELEVLKLEEYAFRGEFWEIDENFVFKALRFLRIGRTDLVHWVAYPSSFPVLETLAIRHCTRLRAVPSNFDAMYNLKLLELYCTTKMAAISAREIKSGQADMGNDDLKLSIFPPDH